MPSKSREGAPSVEILMRCFQGFAVVATALALAPFGMSTTVFWIYVSASLLFLVGVIKIFNELPQEHGVDKIMPFGRLFFAIPMAVFGSEHFTATASIATLVPRWIPAHTFWVYLVGLAFLCAALSYCGSRPGTAGSGSGRHDDVRFSFSSWTCQLSLRTPTTDSLGPWR